MASNGPWNLEKYPQGCSVCGRTDQPHAGRGMCPTHYNRDQARRKRERDAVSVSAEPIAITADAEPEEPSAPFSKERAPGSSSSSASLSDAPAPSGTPSLGGRVAKALGLGPKEPPAGEYVPPPVKPTKERTPGGPKQKRTSISEDVGRVFESLGSRLARLADPRLAPGPMNPPLSKHYALGQYMTLNAAASGEVIDDAVAGTIVDKKLLQPLAHGKDRLGAIGGVVGPPLIIFAIESQPQLFPQLYPVLYAILDSTLDVMLPAKRKAEQKAAKRAQTLRDAYGSDEPNGDPIADMIAFMFPWAFAEGAFTQPEESPDGQVPS